jgi:hypothetical protein
VLVAEMQAGWRRCAAQATLAEAATRIQIACAQLRCAMSSPGRIRNCGADAPDPRTTNDATRRSRRVALAATQADATAPVDRIRHAAAHDAAFDRAVANELLVSARRDPHDDDGCGLATRALSYRRRQRR